MLRMILIDGYCEIKCGDRLSFEDLLVDIGLMVYYLVFEVDRDMRSSTCVIFMDLMICS